MVPVSEMDQILRPTLEGTIRALRLYPSVDVQGDADLAEALEATEEFHQPTEENADSNKHYGRCAGCGEWWPCRAWAEAAYPGLEWLVLMSNAVMRRSGTLGPAAAVGGKPGREIEIPACFICRTNCSGCSCREGTIHGEWLREERERGLV